VYTSKIWVGTLLHLLQLHFRSEIR
jgi:hypothetical protein